MEQKQPIYQIGIWDVAEVMSPRGGEHQSAKKMHHAQHVLGRKKAIRNHPQKTARPYGDGAGEIHPAKVARLEADGRKVIRAVTYQLPQMKNSRSIISESCR